MSSAEHRPLLSSAAAATAAASGATLVNQTVAEVQQARADGPLTFRMLGFLGGLAMIFSNGIAILERFFSFEFASAMIAVYNVLFGIVIAFLDAPGPCGRRIKGGIHYYAKFLEFTWGRGALYFFVGSLQVANWNMLDWAVGGFMMFVGVTAIGVGIAAARDLRLLKHSLQSEQELKEQWAKHDSDGNGFLDVKELTAFVADARVAMSRNEIAATFLALGTLSLTHKARGMFRDSLFLVLDKNFDEKIAYEEFYSWWTAAGTYGGGRSFSV